MNYFSEIKSQDCSIKIGGRTKIGKNVVLGPSCKNINIGYGCYLGNDIYIDVEVLHIKDYTSIHHGSIIHGIKTFIGFNCWIGHYTIIDSLGGQTELGNNVGVGAHSQLWSHMKFGDVLAGCRWHSTGRLKLDDDVWLVGRSIVGPIHAESKSMLMTGGVAVKNMKSNHIYAGNPARDMTDKFGTQFELVELNDKFKKFDLIKKDFYSIYHIDISQFECVEEFYSTSDKTLFNLNTREYKPRYTQDEYLFMKYMLYDKAKFVPFIVDNL